MSPNSLGGGCPFQAGVNGFVSFPSAIAEDNTPIDKVRGKPEKFAEHYNQPRLFFESQTEVEKSHIAGGFRFELSKVTVPAIRKRMVASLRNVSDELAQAVAHGLGIELPEAMPRAIERTPAAEVRLSPALSLMALPGDGGITTRKVAIVIADGLVGESITSLIGELTRAGAVPSLLGSRLGTVTSVEGKDFEADATLENSPAVLFDAVVFPDGEAAVQKLAKDGHSMEFIKDQYRHGKTILALGASSTLLDKAGIPKKSPSGRPDPGILTGSSTPEGSNAKALIIAIGKHRHSGRESDPPRI